MNYTIYDTMEDILNHLPAAKRALFARYHLGGCSACAFDKQESLAQLAERNQLNPDEMLTHLVESEQLEQAMWLSPQEAKKLCETEKCRLIDLRTREEYEATLIDGAELFTQALQQELFAQKTLQTIILYDHLGNSVLDQVAWFRGHGIAECYGIRGGIDAWSQEVDSKVLRYRLELE